MKYEYKTIKLPADGFFNEEISGFEIVEADKFINRLGQEGWELVSTEGMIEGSFGRNPETHAIILFFKRPLAE